jgi:hypothetical protein
MEILNKLQLIDSMITLTFNDFNFSLIFVNGLVQADNADKFFIKARYLVVLRLPALFLVGATFLHIETFKHSSRIYSFK